MRDKELLVKYNMVLDTNKDYFRSNVVVLISNTIIGKRGNF